MEDWTAAERMLSSAGALGILLVLAWRLPCIVKVMLDFGLQVQRLNAELLKACCTKKRAREHDSSRAQDNPNVIP